MNVDKWGPGGWIFLHTITFNYPLDPDENDKERYKTFFNMVSILPYLGRQILQKHNTKYLCHERQECVKAKIPKKKSNKTPEKNL